MRGSQVDSGKPTERTVRNFKCRLFSGVLLFVVALAPLALSSCAGYVGGASANKTSNSSDPPSAPTITTQPASQMVMAGQTATFSVAAAGTAPLTYQWQKGGANIAGANSASYTTPATTSSSNGTTFAAVVSNMAGTATSSAAMLTVTADPVAPTIMTQPVSQTVNAGQTATFSVAAEGTAPLTYQWQKGGANIAGANSASYTTPATTSSNNGTTFAVVVSNTAGTATRLRGDAHCDRRSAGAHDHHAARRPDGLRRTDRHVLRRGRGNRTPRLPVAKGGSEHRRSQFGELHHSRNHVLE